MQEVEAAFIVRSEQRLGRPPWLVELMCDDHTGDTSLEYLRMITESYCNTTKYARCRQGSRTACIPAKRHPGGQPTWGRAGGPEQGCRAPAGRAMLKAA